jgi:hypothetical protein
MRRRLLLVLCVVAALASTSVAAGGGGAKYKLSLTSVSASCSTTCPIDPGTIVITRLDDNRTSCHPFGGFSDCNWTAKAGTKVVLETTADPPFVSHTWGAYGGACSGTGKCVVTMDSNKVITLAWVAP